MARRRRAEQRDVAPDLRYNNPLVAHLINSVMRMGKKTIAEHIIYSTLDFLKQETGQEPLEVLLQAMENVKPRVEVRSRRVGGATYQVPVEVASGRQQALATRWLIQFAQSRKGVPMEKALGLEVLDAFKNQGNAIKKRDDTHKMAQANKAFAHYKW